MVVSRENSDKIKLGAGQGRPTIKQERKEKKKNREEEGAREWRER